MIENKLKRLKDFAIQYIEANNYDRDYYFVYLHKDYQGICKNTPKVEMNFETKQIVTLIGKQILEIIEE